MTERKFRGAARATIAGATAVAWAVSATAGAIAWAKPAPDTEIQVDANVTAQVVAKLPATTDAVAASADAEFDYAVQDITVTKNAPKPRPVPATAAATAVSATVVAAAAAAPAGPAPGQAVDGNAIVAEGMKYIGVPYLAGGKTPDGFDCSGFIQYIYGLFGISTPSSSSGYANIGTRVSAADALPGDIIYTPGHVGIYAGGGQQLDAPVPGKTLQLRGIWQSNPVYIRIG